MAPRPPEPDRLQLHAAVCVPLAVSAAIWILIIRLTIFIATR